ncbi:MAG: hypothetical protein ABI707_11815 [Ferruginibacter sp.]
MKKQSAFLFTQISTRHLENFTTIVKETLAVGFNQPKSKTFTAADLWNIQRQGKGRTQRSLSY